MLSCAKQRPAYPRTAVQRRKARIRAEKDYAMQAPPVLVLNENAAAHRSLDVLYLSPTNGWEVAKAATFFLLAKMISVACHTCSVADVSYRNTSR